MVAKVVFSSKSSEWETPDGLYNYCNDFFGPFDIDVAASAENTKCADYYDEKTDALQQEWFGNVWCNPPYGRGVVEKWVEKAISQTAQGNADTVCMLLPARTDTKWFHDLVYVYATEVYFIKGRVRFEGPDNSGAGAPFPSMVVIFRKEWPRGLVQGPNVGLIGNIKSWPKQ